MGIADIHRVYFIGIGGIGMSALARYFLLLGKEVCGYDRTQTPLTEELSALGISIHYNDDIEEIPAVFRDIENTLVVYTPAVPDSHSELQFFLEKGFEVKKRSEVLGIITRDTFCFAVAGTHGKTTTTSLLASIFAEARTAPTFVIGGLLNAANANAQLGEGPYFIAEADESDASFLHLQPMSVVLTNIEADHMATYGGDFERLNKLNESLLQA
ncbi:MAG: Mur ligase domain-containing protein, partial [Bacteroidota bacterium]